MHTVEHPVVVTSENIPVEDKNRALTVVTPQQPKPLAPIVLLLHGSNQNGQKLRAFAGYRFDSYAEQGAVVAYLDGYQGNWNDARISNSFPARREGFDDTAFTVAVIDLLAEQYGADASRVYAIGFSNGGQQVIRLAHEVPDRLSGIALLSSTQPVAENFAPTAPQNRPLPTLIVHGTRDRLVPYSGGIASLWGFRPRGPGLSASDTAAYYAARNAITTPPTVHRLTAPDRHGLWAERTDYQQDGSFPVTLITIHGGGHTIPGPKRAPRIMGRTATSPDTAELIANFFPLPVPAH